MTRNSLSFAVSAALLVLLALFAAPANAQATRTWISGVGDDANPCSRTAPCKTFAGAISKTARNGEINCLDPGGFGSVTITKSITLDCHEIYASILNSGTNGIYINFNSFDPAADVRKTVRIRNLNFNGADTGVTGIQIVGGATISGGVVIVEDCLIDGNFAGAGNGIVDYRTGGGEIYVLNTTVRNTANGGIVLSANSAASLRIDAMLNNVRVLNSGYGVIAGNGGRVMISNSVFAGNTSAGIYAAGATNPVEVNVNSSVSSNNGTGILNGGGTVTIRLDNNDIAFNTTGITGATQSFTSNRISGNGAAGTAPTAIGAVTNPTGQQ